MISAGCESCFRAKARCGTCHLCGRTWGDCAVDGVHPDSPCPCAPQRHSWVGSPKICAHCGQRQATEVAMQSTGTPEKACGGQAEAAEKPELTPMQALRATFLQVSLQHNQIGEQLKVMLHVINALAEERNHLVKPTQVKRMTEKEFKEHQKALKKKPKGF